jgi:tRNA threonylcarbamoyladenosine biosynthesis protein TsaE
MNEERLLLRNAAATEAIGSRLGKLLRAGDVVLLRGELGTGKTTLARGVLAALDFGGEVASPTFPIVIGYEPPEVRLPLFHVDLYRIEGDEELEELGLDEARKRGAILVEWPDRLGPRLKQDALCLALAQADDSGRILTWQASQTWEARWPPLLT